MKKYILLLLLVGSFGKSYSQNIFELYGRSQEFFQSMADNKFEDAQGFFDTSVHGTVTPESLKTLWSQISTNLGEVESVDLIKSSVNGEFFRVLVEAKFSKASQNFMLVFNKNQKLTGLFLAPKENIPSYTQPAYSDTTKFSEKEIIVETKDHKLVGMFTYPKNASNFPVVVLVHGSGPADMDQSVGPNKTFKDIATGLASQGVASIRYVKRTMIYEIPGVITVKEETIDDAVAALNLAKKQAGVNPKKVFLYGHSLGGMLAPRIAIAVPDLAGMIIAAGPARKLTDVIVEQNHYFFNQTNDTTAALKTRFDEAILNLEKSRITELKDIKPDSILTGLPAAYWVDLNKMDQIALAKSSKAQIYIAQGGMDFQVGQKDFDLWVESLKGKKNVTSKLYPTLDHFFIEQTEKGNPSQYQKPANVHQAYITDLANWIKSK